MIRITLRFFVTWGLLPVFLWIFASCSRDTKVTNVTDGEMTLNVGFKMPVRSSSTNGYEEGEAYESYIDIENGNYRIYFFDAANKLIARFEPDGFIVTEGSNYRNYNVLGKAPDALIGYSTLKMVVLANWPIYNDTNIKTGETTIDDICNANWARFNASTSLSLEPGKKFLIPFYGVREYNGITLKAGQATILPKPVTLLRAVAKVEVILNTTDDDSGNSLSDDSFADVSVCHYNAHGYCAPSEVYSQNDYGQGNDWDNDYLPTLHLINGENDTDATSRKLSFHCLNRRTDTENEKWIVYLPEYNNEGNDYSYIEIRLDSQASESESYKVYFAKYENGKPNIENRFNIARNNLYRFTITVRNGRIIVNVKQWDNAFDNEYNFDE
ncbi:hypothetical protein [uncultured Bacteroides sp.]|uniref:hypothetical protein n=1 Tax=uncultured Bacteroides sp. TaxID=162156 RepID=UPI0025CC3C70|nr:hypothetical protein [uncultured Bacteroides sp.]